MGEIRRMYFELKDNVFIEKIGDILLPDSQTEVLENILKKAVGEHTTLASKTHPRYIDHIMSSCSWNDICTNFEFCIFPMF